MSKANDPEVAALQAARFLELLEDRGWDLDRLADETGIDRALLSGWADATASPPIVILGIVVEALVPDPEKREFAVWYLVGRVGR